MAVPQPHLTPRASASALRADIAPDQRECIPLSDVSASLATQAAEAARSGRRAEALKLLDEALTLNENNVDALIWLGGLSRDPGESLRYLEKAAALAPDNQQAREGLMWARQRANLARPPATVPSAAKAAPGQAGRSMPPAGLTQEPSVAAVTAPPAERPLKLASAPVRAKPSGPTGGRQSAVRPRLVLPSLPPVKLPDVAGNLRRAFLYLAAHPTLALIVAVILLGLLGTAAVARAGMSGNGGRKDNALPSGIAIPTVQVASSPAFLTVSPSSSVAATVTQPTASWPTVVAQPTASRPATVTVTQPVTSSVVAVNVSSEAALDQAWVASDWPRAIAILTDLRQAKPNDAALTKKLFTAHFNYAVQLVRSERLAEAVAEFDKALAIDPNDKDAKGERLFAKLYLDGTTALNQNDYAAAIAPLREIYDGNPNYRQVTPRLYQAYVGLAAALEKGSKPVDAYGNYEKAAAINPDGQEAKDGMARLKDTPGIVPANTSGKKIEVDLTKQRVIAYQNGQVVYRFVASTGKAPYVTRTGNFKILDKMATGAYSTSMGWGMPWWMGIYYAGSSENGFHGMARLRNGTVLSTSVLGRPATHGCIMLSDADARTLFNWAEIGIPVWIHY